MALHSYVASRLASYGAILSLGDVADILSVDIRQAKRIALSLGAWDDPDEGILIERARLEGFIRERIR